MNFDILHFDSLASTNDEALRKARSGAAEGLCVIAAEQTAGRGRHGREWISEKDAGLYLSLVLRPKLETCYLSLITLMSGIAVHETLRKLGMRPDIKWVNDIHSGEKKIAGILAETTDTDRGLAVIVGIGVNLKAIGQIETSTSIETEIGQSIASNDLADRLLPTIDTFYEALASADGSALIIDEWRNRSTYYMHKPVTVRTATSTFEGVTDGLEKNGALRVRRDDGTISVVQAGDVEMLRSVPPAPRDSSPLPF